MAMWALNLVDFIMFGGCEVVSLVGGRRGGGKGGGGGGRRGGGGGGGGGEK